MKEIILTHGKVALVDDADFASVSETKWHARRQGDTYYAEARYRKDGNDTTISMHRVILGITDRVVVIDHKNVDGLDNRRCNLRIANHAKNMANRRSAVGSSSKYLGVTWNKSKKRWRVFIQKDKKHIFLGQFKDETEAALAYNRKALELHGEFANLNKLDPSLEIKRNGQPYKTGKKQV